jgi:hypothetical protein
MALLLYEHHVVRQATVASGFLSWSPGGISMHLIQQDASSKSCRVQEGSWWHQSETASMSKALRLQEPLGADTIQPLCPREVDPE